MNTNTLRSTLGWPVKEMPGEKSPTLVLRLAAAPLQGVRRLGVPVLLAAFPALVIVVATAWAVNAFETPRVLQALIWSAGFVFLALAMESPKRSAISLLATGLTLPGLALLSAWIAPGFSIVAAILVAVWTAVAILDRATKRSQEAARSR